MKWGVRPKVTFSWGLEIFFWLWKHFEKISGKFWWEWHHYFLLSSWKGDLWSYPSLYCINLFDTNWLFLNELYWQLFSFYLQIGSSLQRMSQSPVNLNQVAKPSLKEGIMDAIKIGVPGVFNLPQMKSGSNDSHIRWTLIGLEDQLWGKSVALSGR